MSDGTDDKDGKNGAQDSEEGRAVQDLPQNNVTQFRAAQEARQDRQKQDAQVRYLEIANDVLHARQPAVQLPPAVKGLIFLMLSIQIILALLPEELVFNVFIRFGFTPLHYTQLELFSLYDLLAPITALFLHGGWLHIVINIVSLMAFGSALEKALGSKIFISFFLFCGLAGDLFHLILNPHVAMPLIGASGGISGLFGALLLLMRDNGMMGNNPRALWILAGLWIFMTVFFGFAGVPGSDAPIGWGAHLGGFIAGLGFYYLFTRYFVRRKV